MPDHYQWIDNADTPDVDDDFDESQQRGTAMCRGCHEMKHDVLADNGYCSDCD